MEQAISGSRSLHRIVYFSQQAFTPEMDVEDEVDAIIRASIQNNRLDSITGLLVVHSGWFIQALEGPAAAVMKTYGRILNDPRHRDSQLVSAGPAAGREFGEWNMCARQLNATDDAILGTLDQRSAFDPRVLSPQSCLRLLKAVRGIQERRMVVL